jgi:hypothetical protein
MARDFTPTRPTPLISLALRPRPRARFSRGRNLTSDLLVHDQTQRNDMTLINFAILQIGKVEEYGKNDNIATLQHK